MNEIHQIKGYKGCPIMKAVLLNSLHEVQQLISADSQLTNFVHKRSGDSPLILAARNGYKDIVAILLTNNAHVKHKNLDGKCAIHEAACYGSVPVIDILLSHGADVDALKRADWTPLMFACVYGKFDCARSLLQNGADVNRVNKDGWTPFHLSCREGHMDILVYLTRVSESCHLTVSKNGRTPLHTACMHGQLEVCRFLLELPDIDAQTKDSCGSTPFLDSIRFNFLDISNLLVIISNEKCLLDRDNQDKSAIHVAAQSGHVSALEYLVKNYGQDVTQKCEKSGMSALHYAAKEGQCEVLVYLISSLDSLDTQDKFGRTALHLSVAANQVKTTNILLKSAANTRMKDIQGKIPSDYALSTEMKTIIANT